MFSYVLGISFWVCFGAFGETALAPKPIARVMQGAMEGKVMNDLLGGEFYSFQGIPYAEVPVGDLRFKSPVAAGPWPGVLNATDEGNICLQISLLTKTVVGTEDCLYLNVYTKNLPQQSDEPLMPVMVLLHGGGYIQCSGGMELFGPQYLLTENIVYVSMNYRLNVFGFLSFDDPAVQVPGNAGLKDMVLALRWVQENIGSFNGDANSVTIFGESAGAASVDLMRLSPLASGLFHRAIAQSGAATEPWVFTERRYRQFAEHLNYTGSMDDEKEIFAFLNTHTGLDLLAVQQKIVPIEEQFVAEYTQIGVIVENADSNPDAFLTEPPEGIMKRGGFAQVPYITGLTMDEGGIFLSGYSNVKLNFRDPELVVPKFLGLKRGSTESKVVGQKIMQFYYGDKLPGLDDYRQYFDMMTDIGFFVKIMEQTRQYFWMSSYPIYLYLFHYISELNYMSALIDSPIPATIHADDLGYLFPTKYFDADVQPDSIEMRGIHRMIKFWTNFAKTGNPNAMDNDPLLQVNWVPVNFDGGANYLLIQDENLTMVENLWPERLQFWDDLINDVQNCKY